MITWLLVCCLCCLKTKRFAERHISPSCFYVFFIGLDREILLFHLQQIYIRRSQSIFPHLGFWKVNLSFLLTVIAVVVHQDDFFEQVSRSVIDSRVDRAQDHRQSLVDEDEDEGDLGEISRVADLSASARGDTQTHHAICKTQPFPCLPLHATAYLLS